MRCSALLGGVLILSIIAIGGLRWWEFSIVSAEKAGNVELHSGRYSVRRDGVQAVFTRPGSGTAYRVSFWIEHSTRLRREVGTGNNKRPSSIAGMAIVQSKL